MLKLNVDSLGEDPQSFTWALRAEEVDLDSEFKLLAPVELTGTLYRIHRKVYIRGHAFFRVEMVCARCLDEFTADLECEIFIIGVPSESMRTTDENFHDAVVVVYSGVQLDLFPEVRSGLILALPIKPLCSPDCPGLCSQCGLRKVAGQCRCEESGPKGPQSDLNM